MRILTTQHNPAVQAVGGYCNWISSMVIRRWGITPDWHTKGEPRPAFILRSQWTVSCDICPEQIIYEPGEPFYCTNCCNAKNGHRARPVVLPHERDGIESLLVRRIDPNTRNWWPSNAIRDLRSGGWLPGLKLKDLINEQREHGELYTHVFAKEF